MSSDARNLLRGKDWIGSSVYQGFASSVVCTAAMRCIAVCDLCICICMAGLMEWLFAKEGWHGQRIALWLKSIKYKERWHSQRIVPWPSELVEKYDFNPRQKNPCYEQSQHSLAATGAPFLVMFTNFALESVFYYTRTDLCVLGSCL